MQQFIPKDNKIQINYYPTCIKQHQTEQNINAQVSVVVKIYSSFCKRKNIPRFLLKNISAYIFQSPVCLSFPLYKLIENCQVVLGTFLLYNQQNKSTIRLEIKKIWKKIEKESIAYQKIMRLAVLFDDCMELKNNHICDQLQNEENCKIISENNRYYQGLFKVLNKYKKDGVINEYVLRAFKQIMSKNILIVNFNYLQQYIVIQSTHNGQHNSLHHKYKINKVNLRNQNVKIGFIFQNDKVIISSNPYNLYRLSDKIVSRNKQKLLDPQTMQQITLNDIYIE